MGEAFIVRRGGGGLSKCSIVVHIDTGSSVAAYSNSAATTLVKTGKEIGTSGDYLITGLDIGTYYVKATKNGKAQISAPITFAAPGLRDVVLSYSLDIFANGVLTDAAGGLKSIHTSGDPDKWELQESTAVLHLQCTGYQYSGASTYKGFVNLFDLSSYSYLHIKAKVSLAANTSASFGINLDNSSTFGNRTTLTDTGDNFEQFDVPLSLLPKDNYIIFNAIGSAGWAASNVYISDIWAD